MAKKILVVDDEESIQSLLTAIFTGEGYDVESASDGTDGLEKAKNGKPDLILLDMMMPGMSGREMSEKLRADPKTKNMKIAFLTVAKFSETGKETLEKLGILDYITKPFENDDLIKRVKKIIG